MEKQEFNFFRYKPYLLNRVISRINSAFSKESSKYDLTIPMWRVLKVLNETDNQSVGELVERTSIEQSSLSRVLISLEKLDYVVRQRSQEDSRVVRVRLTARGRKTVRKLIPIAIEFEDVALQGFSENEINTLEDFLNRLYHNIADLEKHKTNKPGK